jgi:hypothetical protein
VKKARSLSTPIGVDEGKADRPPSRAVSALRPWRGGFYAEQERSPIIARPVRPLRLLLWAAAIGLAGWGAGQANAADDGLKETWTMG